MGAESVWRRFKAQRLGWWSLCVLLTLLGLSLCAELLSNDRPLLLRYHGQWYAPAWVDYPETTFGGDFHTPTDYLDPFIARQIDAPGQWVLWAPNRYGAQTINYFAPSPNPAPPSARNWLGTDDRGRDVLAQLIYGFRLSLLFALALTALGTLLGVAAGALQGYVGGRVDLYVQRAVELWAAMPELYLLIIFSAVFAPSVALLLGLLALFGWMGLADYVRAEFLRNRQMDYVRAARALGVGHWAIVWRHVLPNSLTPVVTFLPFRMSGAILALTSLDFLGLGVPPGTPSLGELLAQGKSAIDAWWISLSTFGLLALSLLLLTFVGDALRDALDPRRSAPVPGAAGEDDASVKPEVACQGACGATTDAALERAGQGRVLLRVRDLRLRLGTRALVDGVCLDLQAGQTLALVGESGSGKTLTALALMGLADGLKISGSALLDGRELLQNSEQDWQRLRGRELALVFQEPMTALNPVLRVGVQLAEALAQRSPGASAAQRQTQVLALLAEVELPEPARIARSWPHQLSGGQRQRVLIAMALAAQPRVLLADEPTTALDASLRVQMLQLIDRLRQRHGMAVLLISHDLPLVRGFADRVAVMTAGQVVEQGPTAAVLGAPQHPYTRALLAAAPTRLVQPLPATALTNSRDAADAADTAPSAHRVLLRVRDVAVAYPGARAGWAFWREPAPFWAVQGAAFDLLRGQTLAVMGESGSGKSTLALAVLGLLRAQGDVLWADGLRWQGRARADRALRQRVQAVFQDPYSALSPRLTVGEIVAEGLRVHAPALAAAQRLQRVRAALAEVGLAGDDVLARHPHAFSGGQRQRIALARALVVQPQVLVLDEPTSALDLSVQRQVLALLADLQRRRGLSYLLITHDVGVVRALAHQVLVMQAARVVESGPAEQVLGAPQHATTRALLAACAPARHAGAD